MQATDTEVWNTDTNLTARFSTGALDHTVLGGLDYMRYARHLQQSDLYVDNLATSTTGFPLQSIWNIYAPQYNQLSVYISPLPGGGAAFIPADAVKLNDRGTEVQQSTGLYVQDQVKLGNWTAVLGLRQDWLDIEQDGEASRSDQATTGPRGAALQLRLRVDALHLLLRGVHAAARRARRLEYRDRPGRHGRRRPPGGRAGRDRFQVPAGRRAVHDQRRDLRADRAQPRHRHRHAQSRPCRAPRSRCAVSRSRPWARSRASSPPSPPTPTRRRSTRSTRICYRRHSMDFSRRPWSEIRWKPFLSTSHRCGASTRYMTASGAGCRSAPACATSATR